MLLILLCLDLAEVTKDLRSFSFLSVCFCHFLLAQKVTQKGTTKTNHLLVLVAQGYTPGLAELVVRTFRGQPARRRH